MTNSTKKSSNGVNKGSRKRGLRLAAAAAAAAATGLYLYKKRKGNSLPEEKGLPKENDKFKNFEDFKSPHKTSNPLPDDPAEYYVKKVLEVARDNYISHTGGVMDSKPYELLEDNLDKNKYLAMAFEAFLDVNPNEGKESKYRYRQNIREIINQFDQMNLENYVKGEMKTYLEFLEKVARQRYSKKPAKEGGGKSRKNKVKKTVKKSVKKL